MMIERLNVNRRGSQPLPFDMRLSSNIASLKLVVILNIPHEYILQWSHHSVESSSVHGQAFQWATRSDSCLSRFRSQQCNL